VCPRHTAVLTHGRVPLKLTDVAGADYVTVDRHKKYPGAGKKTTMRSGVSLLLGPLCVRLMCVGEGGGGGGGVTGHVQISGARTKFYEPSCVARCSSVLF